MKRALPCLALLIACDTTEPRRVEAPADSAAGEVPFQEAGAHDAAIIVPVRVNGTGPFRFVLDTGATLTCIDRALADSLGVREMEGVSGMGAGIGGTGRMSILEIDSLAVGAARVEQLPTCALDLAHLSEVGLDVDGLLGLNFLEAFRVTLDFERDVLILQGADGATGL